MLKQQFPTHYFHAYGYALGGTITKPFHATVESQAATCIPATGGHAHASISKFQLRELIRFDYASTQISAVEEDDSYDTVITTTIEKLNIFNQFTADRIVAHLAIKAMKKPAPALRNFRTVGTRYENMRVGGIEVKPTLVDEDGEQYRTRLNPVFDLATGEQIKQASESGSGILTSLVSNLNVVSDRVTSKGNAIHVPDFGVVYLAEYLVSPNERHLNMFRVRMGCANEGGISGGGAGGNGSQAPPTT